MDDEDFGGCIVIVVVGDVYKQELEEWDFFIICHFFYEG